jgi:hypothetical protein
MTRLEKLAREFTGQSDQVPGRSARGWWARAIADEYFRAEIQNVI